MLHEKRYVSDVSSQRLLAGVYGWMGAGLLVSAIIAFLTIAWPQFFLFLHQTPLFFGFLLMLQIGVAVSLVSALPRFSFGLVLGLFFVYAALTGLTLSGLFLLYTATSLITTFLTCAGMFLSMALYGHYTRADLSGIGNVCLMLLWGLMFAMIINIFMRNSMVDLIISAFAVVIFTLFIAYDVQRIKNLMHQQLYTQQGDGQMLYKITVLGAFILYLDFINLFIHLLQLMGKRRKE